VVSSGIQKGSSAHRIWRIVTLAMSDTKESDRPIGAIIGTGRSVALVESRNIPAMKKIRFAMISNISGSLDRPSRAAAKV
jgi:hypothetical protein